MNDCANYKSEMGIDIAIIYYYYLLF